MGHRKLLRLPRSKNGHARSSSGFGCYKYQREQLKALARGKGMSVSLYLNLLLWKDITVKQLNRDVDEDGELSGNILKFKVR
jgi:hypothetical protein